MAVEIAEKFAFTSAATAGVPELKVFGITTTCAEATVQWTKNGMEKLIKNGRISILFDMAIAHICRSSIC